MKSLEKKGPSFKDVLIAFIYAALVTGIVLATAWYIMGG